MTTAYLEWLLVQSPRRRVESARFMRICRLLGKAQRRYLFSRRTERLTAAVRRYYGGSR